MVLFNSTNKYALYICEYPTNNSEYCLFIKGAPEKIWKFSTRILVNGVVTIIGAEEQKVYAKINKQFAKNGERVLGFAKTHLPKEQYPKGFKFSLKNPETYNFPLDDLTFVGLISLTDPPRDAVPDSVMKCITAGVKVIMVTGDQPITATAIARQVNIIRDKTVGDLIEEGIPKEEAFKQAKGIVITGTMLM